MCSRRENAAVVLPEHVSLRTERDPGVLTACECSSMQQCCRMNMSVCARKEIQVCSRRGNAAVFLAEHVSLRTEGDPSVRVACERSSLVA